MIYLYLDEIMNFCSNLECVEETLFLSNFDTKDLGEVDVFLGMKILMTDIRLVLTQNHYIEKMLKRSAHFECNPISTPVDLNIKLEKNPSRSINQLGVS